MLILLATFGYAADCVEPVSASEVATRVDDALLTWATMDEDGFKEALDGLEVVLPCVDEPLKPAQAAAVHRVMGLRSFIDGDTEGATASFRSAAVAEPGYKLSERLAPEGGKLWTLYNDAADQRAPIVYAMPLPKGYRSWVDGEQSDRRANEIPAIVQVGPAADAKDSIVWTGLVDANEEFRLPELEALPDGGDPSPLKPDKQPKAAKTPKKPKGGGNGALWGAAAGTGVAAGGLFAASAAMRSGFNNDPTKGKYNAVNGTYLASVGLGAVAGGLVIAAIAK